MAQRPDAPKDTSSYPRFQPHITLCSVPSATFDSLRLRNAVPRVQRAVPVRFTSLEKGIHYFRSVYVAVQPTDALSALHAHIHAALGIAPATIEFPHMSLYYIGDADATQGESERICENMASRGAVLVAPGGGIMLDCGADVNADVDPSTPTKLNGFLGSEIWVMDCDGPVKGWKCLDRIVIGA
jgi:2',3'-cyclic-nucleotide 3'-phosphodiesterase